tara:strand:- start:4670 stop:5809 length:1140 start_codon:yes stop_codon:yes gene_type:complete
MKIALITDGITPYVMGGMQRHSALLAQHLAKLGVEVHLFHTCKGPQQISKARELKGITEDALITYHFIDYPTEGKLPGHYVRDLKKYSRLVLSYYQEAKIDADFIYTQGLTGWAFIEAKAHGVVLPQIGVNCHGYEMFQWAANIRGRVEQWILRPPFQWVTQHADLVFSFDAKIKEIVINRLGKPVNQVAVVANAIDQEWCVSEPAPSGPIRKFLFVGRYERRKGVPEIHQAIQSCKDPRCEFHFIGPVPKDVQLDDPRVRYHGAIMDPEKLKEAISQCDVLLCPSYAEGMPTVILEAMARGLAIIATDVGASSVMVGPENGILLDHCSAAGIGSAVASVLQWPDEELTEMRVASLVKVEEFIWDRVAQQTLLAIEQAI